MDIESFNPPVIKQIVKMVRLTLYNHGLPCGPRAIQKGLVTLSLRPIPSITTIKRILARHGLTHGRTGHYP
jgi:putative transposase